jgi:hypothetical protein
VSKGRDHPTEKGKRGRSGQAGRERETRPGAGSDEFLERNEMSKKGGREGEEERMSRAKEQRRKESQQKQSHMPVGAKVRYGVWTVTVTKPREKG